MSSLEFRRCPSCHTIGAWQGSRAQGFVERRVLTYLGFSAWRCTKCRQRIVAFGDQRQMPNPVATKNRRARVQSTNASASRVSPQDDRDFRNLIAKLKRSEEELEGDDSR